jgi:hypothetical protein
MVHDRSRAAAAAAVAGRWTNGATYCVSCAIGSTLDAATMITGTNFICRHPDEAEIVNMAQILTLSDQQSAELRDTISDLVHSL